MTVIKNQKSKYLQEVRTYFKEYLTGVRKTRKRKGDLNANVMLRNGKERLN